MVNALILTSPDSQVWHLLELPAPGETEAQPIASEGCTADSGELGGSGNTSSFRAFSQREKSSKCEDFLL